MTAKPTGKAPAKKAAASKPAAKAVAKKAPAKATAKKAPSKPVANAAGLTEKFLEQQLALLLEERESYFRQAESLKAEADTLAELREPGDVQFDEESGEGDTLAVERERDLALSAQARAAIDEIDAALQRLIDGTYGICERCGKNIGKPRLEALPHAALCIDCKAGGLGRL